LKIGTVRAHLLKVSPLQKLPSAELLRQDSAFVCKEASERRLHMYKLKERAGGNADRKHQCWLLLASQSGKHTQLFHTPNRSANYPWESTPSPHLGTATTKFPVDQLVALKFKRVNVQAHMWEIQNKADDPPKHKLGLAGTNCRQVC